MIRVLLYTTFRTLIQYIPLDELYLFIFLSSADVLRRPGENYAFMSPDLFVSIKISEVFFPLSLSSCFLFPRPSIRTLLLPGF